MVLRLCLPDSCEENENSSSHCIKLLIINSSLEIGELRHYRYLYRTLLWDKAEISDSVPFCFILIFRRIWVLGNPRFWLQWWVQRAETSPGVGSTCNHRWGAGMEPSLSSVGSLLLYWDMQGTGKALLQLLWQQLLHGDWITINPQPRNIWSWGCCLMRFPLGFPEQRTAGTELVLWRSTPKSQRLLGLFWETYKKGFQRRWRLAGSLSEVLAGVRGCSSSVPGLAACLPRSSKLQWTPLWVWWGSRSVPSHPIPSHPVPCWVQAGTQSAAGCWAVLASVRLPSDECPHAGNLSKRQRALTMYYMHGWKCNKDLDGCCVLYGEQLFNFTTWC